MHHDATAHGSDYGMVACDVTGYSADDRAFQTDLPPGRARKSSFKPLNIKDYSETLRGRAYCQRHRHGPGEVQSQSLKDGVLLGMEARQTGRQLPVDLIVQVRETGQGEQRFVEVHRVGIVIGGAEGMV